MENDKDEIKSAVLAFFLGTGYTLLEEAMAVLANRETELANEEEKDKVVEEADELCSLDWAPLDGMDAEDRALATAQLTAHMDDLVALQTRITEIKSRKKQLKHYDAEAVSCNRKGG